MSCFHLIAVLMFAASFQLTPLSSRHCDQPSRQQNVNQSVNPQPAPKTVQISLDADADMLIENWNHQRIGVDFQTKKPINEIPDARTIEREGSLTFVLPFDKSGKPYTVMMTGKANPPTVANLSMTGPGFVVGVRKLNLTAGETEVVAISSNGTAISVIPSRNGPTPQIFLTNQSDRTRPSYRFEVAASSLSRGKIMTVDLDLDAGRLNFKSTDTKKSSLTVSMRRTNPNGSRDSYSHRDVSFDSGYGYAMDFRSWDGKGDISFCRKISWEVGQCTALKNEAIATQPN